MIGRLSLSMMCVSITVAGGLASAQSPLTLEQAQAEARQHAPERAVLDAQVSGAEAIAAPEGRVFRADPELSVAYAPGVLAAQPEELSWTIGARWTVDVSRSWVPRARSANADLERARWTRDDGLRALDERVAAALADVAFNQELAARAARVRALQALVTEAEHHRLQVGDGTQLETDAADLDLAGVGIAEEQARAGLDAARVRLARLLGRTDASGLIVADGPEPPAAPANAPDLDAIVVHDPRVRAARAEVDAARFEQEAARRLMTPAPTFGIDVEDRRTDIPVGSFFGSGLASGLGALWHDRGVALNVGVPLPLFDRQRVPRARATARLLAADASLRVIAADVRQQLQQAWNALQAAARAWQIVAPTPAVIDRDAAFLEQAVAAGEFDSVMRAQTLARLDAAGRRADQALRALRLARAAWTRRTAGLSGAP